VGGAGGVTVTYALGDPSCPGTSTADASPASAVIAEARLTG
jgi:hypothetical protein